MILYLHKDPEAVVGVRTATDMYAFALPKHANKNHTIYNISQTTGSHGDDNIVNRTLILHPFVLMTYFIKFSYGVN